jgi:L-threonylcarbamoyladenylate synthase
VVVPTKAPDTLMTENAFNAKHNQSEIASAIDALERGLLIGLPTETVYGLGGDATNSHAVTAIFEAKNRPNFNPLISHVSDLQAALKEGVFSPLALKLANAFWPGPLTLVVPRIEGGCVCDLACAGLTTIALRVPLHPIALEVLRQFDRPIAAPSANISGRPSPTTQRHVTDEMGDRVALVLNGGASAIGIESAVVAVVGDDATLLRLGGLSRADIEVIAGPLLMASAEDNAAPASPGMVLRHYAPKAAVRLNQTKAAKGEILIGFHAIDDDPTFNLSPRGDLREAAANLFALLRAADARNPSAIVVAPIPMHGLGEAINDRLTKASLG